MYSILLSIKNVLSDNRIFPTILMCSGCRKITGIRWGKAHYPGKDWIEISHGLCSTCGPKLYPEQWDCDCEVKTVGEKWFIRAR